MVKSKTTTARKTTAKPVAQAAPENEGLLQAGQTSEPEQAAPESRTARQRVPRSQAQPTVRRVAVQYTPRIPTARCPGC